MSVDIGSVIFFCPGGDTSWGNASFRNIQLLFKLTGELSTTSKLYIHLLWINGIKKIFIDLSAPQLLKRCLSGKTLNTNVSINSVIWKFCPKTSGCGVKIKKIAVDKAIITFNEKCGLEVIRKMNVTSGGNAITVALALDTQRVRAAENKANLMTKEARRAKQMSQKKKYELEIQKEGNVYAPGGY